MLTTRKILLDITDGCTKQESLDVFKMAKSESDLPSLNDYKKLSSAIEQTPTSAPLDIKVKTEEADTKLALEALRNKETGYSNGIKIKEYRPKINSYGKWTPDSQGFDCTIRSKKRKRPHCNIQNEHQMTTGTHEAMPTSISDALHDRFDELDRYCEPCDAIFTTRSSHRLHIRKPHTTPVILSPSHKSRSKKKPDMDDPNAHCNVCECRFRTRSIYRTHLHIIHQIGVSRGCEVPHTFQCPICKLRYKSKRSCDDHVKTKHNTISLL